MNASQYNKARESFGKNQIAMADVLNVTPRTAQNYAAHGVTGPSERLMEALIAMPFKLRNKFLDRKRVT